MVKSPRNAGALVLFICVAAIGCSSSEEVPTAAVPAIEESVAVVANADAASSLVRTPDLAEPQPVQTTAVEFTPPFPERLELFDPPKRAQSAVRRDDDRSETVELKGFIHVDQPRAVLSIDGVISLVPEGGEKYGVHVRSIQPPSVVLQRGRDRWTATLE